MDKVPFEVGQLVEARSFQKGYRGAWFRCKIINIRKQMCSVDFFDYPDDKEKWTKIYQKNTLSKKKGKMELMFRPSFPCIYHESEVLPSALSETIVLLRDVWRVGDLVDWWCSGCYWSGKITKILEGDKVQVELLQPPMGEGQTYEAYSKHLRPSLDWTPEHGWVVPSSKDGEGSCSCAQIVQPCKEAEGRTARPNFLDTTEDGMDVDLTVEDINDDTSRQCPSPGLSSVIHPSSMVPDDSVESSIMKLEELAVKIRWLQGLMKFGFKWSNAIKPSWKLAPGLKENDR